MIRDTAQLVALMILAAYALWFALHLWRVV